MTPERKTVMISARLPADLVARVDFVTRNDISPGAARNRSAALQTALENWLPGRENDVGKVLGTASKKAR